MAEKSIKVESNTQISNMQREAKPLIAFIDNNKDVRDATTALMEFYGLEAKTYASCTVLIADLDNDRTPDCIGLNFHLPDINGIDLM